jgi:hypothetical protein
MVQKVVGMGARRSRHRLGDRAGGDGALRLVGQLLAGALAAFLGAAGCQDQRTVTITFRVSDLDSACRLRSCTEIPLGCINSARATLLPDGAAPIVGACVTTAHAAGANPPTLCEPTRLFPGPLFAALSDQRLGLRIEAFNNAAGTAGCGAQDLVFTAGTKSSFQLAAQAASGMPVDLAVSCNAQNPCAVVLNPTGRVLNWPPSHDRDPDGDPPEVPPSSTYYILFGYTLATASPLSFHSLFTINYNPLLNEISGTGIYSNDARSEAAHCVGFQSTVIPTGSAVTTLTCLDKTRLTGTIQQVNAYVVDVKIATAIAQAQKLGLDVNAGVLLGQVRHDQLAASGARVSVTLEGGGDGGAQLFYLDDGNHFVPAASAAGGTFSSGIFAVAGGAGGVTVGASWQGRTAAPAIPVIVPGVATVVLLDL